MSNKRVVKGPQRIIRGLARRKTKGWVGAQTELVSVRIPHEDLRRYRAYCTAKGKSIQEMLRSSVAHAIAKAGVNRAGDKPTGVA